MVSGFFLQLEFIFVSVSGDFFLGEVRLLGGVIFFREVTFLGGLLFLGKVHN